MDRRDSILALLAFSTAAGPSLVVAQPAKPPRRIAILEDGHESSRASQWAAFRKRLQELGYVEGKSYVIDGRWARGEYTRLPALAAELVALKSDLIVAASTPAALAAKKATASVPIVAIGPTDPVKSGLVASLAQPGGNVTGVTALQSDISGKWIELLREVAPKVKSIAFLAVTDNEGSAQIFRAVQEHARPLGLTVQFLDGRNQSNVQHTFGTIARERIDGLIVGATAVVLDHRQQVVDSAARQRVPAVYARREYVEAGGLISYGAELNALWSRGADLVHRILQGAKPSELPFEQASTFKMVLNLKAAKALGVKIPESVRVRVDEVIQLTDASFPDAFAETMKFEH